MVLTELCERPWSIPIRSNRIDGLYSVLVIAGGGVSVGAAVEVGAAVDPEIEVLPLQAARPGRRSSNKRSKLLKTYGFLIIKAIISPRAGGFMRISKLEFL